MSSEEAKEDVFREVLPQLVSTIRASSSLAAQDVNFYKSIDETVSQEIDAAGKRLLNITNDLMHGLTSEEDSVKIQFGKENIQGDLAWNPIGRVLDSIFEKIDYSFDHANKRSDNQQPNLEYLDSGSASAGSNEPGKRITKPQLKFRIPVDNSESHPFRPKLPSKPHALKSFEETVKLFNPEPKYEDSIEIIDPAYYPQPYESEIDNQPYPDSILQSTEPIPSKDWSSTEATWVDTIEGLNQMVDALKKGSREIAVDLEHHDYRTYYGIVCLMQISNREQDWIIDTLALRDDLTILNTIFTDPSIVKVFHGAFMDIIWLQRDLGLYIVSLFDTYCASKNLGFPKHSLAYLLETFAHFKTSKKYQLADWRIRPLSHPMLSYARSDTHFLLNIYDQLRNKLLHENKLPQVLYDSRQVAKRRFEYTKYRPMSPNGKVSCPVMSSNPREPYSSIMYQYNLPHFKKPVVEVLYNWRDLVAKREDESVRYIMPNQLLVTLALLEAPIDATKILNSQTFVSEHVRLHAKELAELIEKTLAQTEANDWDLVDKWNNNTGNTQENDFDIHDKKMLESINGLFNSLVDSSQSLFNPTGLVVAKDKSVAEKQTRYTFEYNVSTNSVVKHNFDDVSQERLEHAWKGLIEMDSLSKVEIPIEEAVEEVPQETEAPVEVKLPSKPADLLFTKNKQIDPNQLITLRERKIAVPKRPSQKLAQEKQSVVDYSNADKIMISGNKRNNNKDKKKKSFDPYSRESEGPKPAKRAKITTSGKSSTFKNKRK
ncbi:Exosome complex exonuclease RRP6 [Spathaspora sp. JA1]|nr:Exosome complex exonuclease RRP6 [Spathaspora sp. JA1]